ncbi:MAG TPA: ATP-dependent helicase, partial [Clostridiales bacterium UBA8960]|nr:ATP-dependent helicase [Clostridiales bacterium UBA8960]
MLNQKFRTSVRELVEFVYRSGDLDMRFQGKSKMADGIKVHQKIQRSQGSDYQPEVSLQRLVVLEEEDRTIELLINGRADGVLETTEGFLIDEIKGTSQFLEDIHEETFPVHWAQVKIYGAIFCADHALTEIQIQLTYAQFETDEIKRIKKKYSSSELEVFLNETIALYRKWLLFKSRWVEKRTLSLERIDFPFKGYRSGQRHLAVAVYNTIKEGGLLYAEAPTGIGKTMSTLFPSIKAMSQGLVDRLFYLSAKTIAKVVAEEAVTRMRAASEGDFHFKTITLTAKDKICINDKVTCYPEKCPYAKGYFDKSIDALWAMINNEDAMTKDTLVDYAEKFQICPYEFSLDLALFCDLIICDYNYAFDPRVYLRRFFEFPTENYVFLVDEAHNLVDRARTMYSAELHKEKFLLVKKNLTVSDKGLSKAIDGVNKAILEVRKRCGDDGIYVHQDEVSELYEQLKRRSQVFEKWLSENHQAEYYEDVLELYFDILGYMRISELYDGGYVFYIVEGQSNKTKIKLFNINPSSQLKRFIDNSQATVFFSATLSPIRYYTTLLTGEVDKRTLSLPSPFDPIKRKLLYATDVSVKYKDRLDAIPKIVEYIDILAKSKVGNYLVFFPSYAYLKQISEVFEALNGDRYEIIKQKRDLSDQEKADFLLEFELSLERKQGDNHRQSLIGFAVLGGHFSEGIDLKGDLLIGVVVIGVGLPMISFEND